MQTQLVWKCDISEFDWYYGSEETYLFIKGEVEVTYDGGRVSFRTGDMVVFPKGLSCVWKVTKPVKKQYAFK